jgi:tRNA A37 methylthiotransferase MiaB
VATEDFVRSVCVSFGFGCPRAEVDNAKLAEYIRANGWDLARRIEDADVVLVTACGFNRVQQVKSLRVLDSACRRRKPGAQVIVVGCLAEIDKDLLHERYDVRLVPPVKNAELDEILGATVPLAQVRDPNEIGPYIDQASGQFDDSTRFPQDGPLAGWARRLLKDSGVRELLLRRQWDRQLSTLWHRRPVYSIRVAQGCLGECTYCAIRFACGTLISKPLDEVLDEFDRGLDGGYTEYRLVAGDLGSYGQDVGTDIAELLAAMMSRPGDFRLTLLDFDLKWFIAYKERLIDIFARNHHRIRCLLIPMQSGSERVLEHMKRGHTSADARAALLSLRRACPGMPIDTHVLVGFPGESEADFEETLDLLRAVGFDRVEFYDYEDRPRTEASRMPDKVPAEVIRRRNARARREIGGRWTALEYAFRQRTASRN